MGLGDYIKETRGELKHVSWPTRRQAIAFSVLVVIICLVMAAFLGFFDLVFTNGLQYIIAHFG